MDKALVEGVLRLKPAERLRLVEVIYESFDRPGTEIDEVWYDEAECRAIKINDLCRYISSGTPKTPGRRTS